MRSVVVRLASAACICLLLVVPHAWGQQVTVGTPFRSLSDGYFEHMGTNWSLNGKGWNFSFGAPNNAAPQFGGFQPSAGANFGFATKAGGVSGQFNANFSQGFRQSLVSQTPSVTLQNGMPGFVSDTSVSPFVMSYIPVVGNYPGFGYPSFGAFSPLGSVWPVAPLYNVPPQGAAAGGVPSAVQQALQRAKAAGGATRLPDPRAEDAPIPDQPPARAMAQGNQQDLALVGGAAESENHPARPASRAQASSAERAAPSVAEARQLRAAERTSQSDEVGRYVELARTAEEAGKPNVAKIYYQMAARRASGELKSQILSRLNELNGQSSEDK